MYAVPEPNLDLRLILMNDLGPFLKDRPVIRECQYTIQYTYDHTFSNATVFYLALYFPVWFWCGFFKRRVDFSSVFLSFCFL
jgi:hypothetical protein